MRTTFRFLDLNVRNSWYHMLDQHLDHWQRLTTVTATEVVMERQREGRPAFHVQVRLEVSKGILHAEANAGTLKAALAEASQDLERQIQARQTQRVERRASERQLSAAAGPQIHEQPPASRHDVRARGMDRGSRGIAQGSSLADSVVAEGGALGGELKEWFRP